MRWQVYWWSAGKQFLVGDSRLIVNLCDRKGMYFTRRYTLSRRPKTLVHICSLEEFRAKGAKV